MGPDVFGKGLSAALFLFYENREFSEMNEGIIYINCKYRRAKSDSSLAFSALRRVEWRVV